MKNDTNTLLGKWQVDGIYEYLQEESRWIYISQYKHGEVEWKFGTKSTLTAYLNSEEDYTTLYVYRTETKELFIDLSFFEVLQTHNIRHIEHYRVDIKSADEIWLYDLEEVDKEPDSYWLAVKITRQSAPPAVETN